jgi:hypothetical protein
MTRNPRKGVPLVLSVCLVALLGAGLAQAELAQNGNIRIAVSGGIEPRALPRSHPAPIKVLMGASISTTDKATPPELNQIVLDINRHGALQTKGLPTCSLAKLESVSAATAQRACAGALVGHGNVSTRIVLPGQGAFATRGGLLAFNGAYHGHQAIFAQVSNGQPLPFTYVIRFLVKHTKGTFGTALDGTVPPIASHYGYIAGINLALKRLYSAHGSQHSFLSADCPAPKGFPGASFAFAKASFDFADGRTLTTTLMRQCKARG